MYYHMKNKMIYLALGSMLMCAAVAKAQNKKEREPGERVQQLKIAFISERLNLTREEAEKFWPIFNDFDDQKMALRKELKDIHKKMKDTSPTEKELTDGINRMTELRKQEADLDKQLLTEVLPVLGVEKTQTLMGLEEDFRKKLMEKFREKRMGKGQGGPPHPDDGPRKF